MAELLVFLCGEIAAHSRSHALITDKRVHGECNVLDSVFAVKHGGNNSGRLCGGIEALYKVAGGCGNRIVGCALAAYDLCGGINYILFDLFKIDSRAGIN